MVLLQLACDNLFLMDFGTFLTALRGQRMLTQEQLAFAAGISTGNYRRIESLATSDIRRSTATAILGALERARPLTKQEMDEFLRHTGLTEFAAMSQRVVDAQLQHLRPALSAVSRSLSDLNDPSVVAAHQALDHLIQTVGVAASLSLITSLQQAVGMAENIRAVHQTAGVQPPTPEREFDVVHPPIQRDGYVETPVITYGVPLPKPIKDAPPQQKKRSS